MAESISLGNFQGFIDRHPDQCPACHNKITPIARMANRGGLIFKSELEIAYTCPNHQCLEMFIAYFDTPPANSVVHDLNVTRPSSPVLREFPKFVLDTSSAFCDIYNEAHAAELLGLSQICGVGYRKALEFLVKDYLIEKRPNDAAQIKSLPLGTCIENYVTDPSVKQVAKLAVWLGNDETHYERRWVDKDLSDLKLLIDLVLHWMQVEHLTAEAIKTMTPPHKP